MVICSVWIGPVYLGTTRENKEGKTKEEMSSGHFLNNTTKKLAEWCIKG